MPKKRLEGLRVSHLAEACFSHSKAVPLNVRTPGFTVSLSLLCECLVIPSHSTPEGLSVVFVRSVVLSAKNRCKVFDLYQGTQE